VTLFRRGADQTILLLHSVAFLQVEFYFSDSNIPRDGFLLEQVKKQAEGCE
jgi:hypothetical protein